VVCGTYIINFGSLLCNTTFRLGELFLQVEISDTFKDIRLATRIVSRYLGTNKFIYFSCGEKWKGTKSPDIFIISKVDSSKKRHTVKKSLDTIG